MAKYGFVVAGTHSGCGKTTVSLGLMAYFAERGYSVQAFKVGPDFIDPGLHRLITGRNSFNLDGWMLTKEYNVNLFKWASHNSDVAIVEGVMGMYDGFDGKTEDGSTAQIAKWADIPVLLVVDARSMARSVAALIHGFVSFDSRIKWAGVVFNRVGSEKHFEYLRDALSVLPYDLPVLGWLPAEREVTLPERHLGLITAEESGIDMAWKTKIASLMERFVDVKLLLEKSKIVDSLNAFKNPFDTGATLPKSSTIAIPRDAAFCFYYEDNLLMLKNAGAKVVEFSPIKGEIPPDDTDAIYIGGGYPELHGEILSENQSFLRFLRERARSSTPIYAECGGLMFLSQYIKTTDGELWPMAGILPFGVRMLKRRRALGYSKVRFIKDCLLGPSGTVVKGHEFHYSDLYNCENDVELVFEVSKGESGDTRLEGFRLGSVLASYIHQHWGSNPEIAVNFLRNAAKNGEEGQS